MDRYEKLWEDSLRLTIMQIKEEIIPFLQFLENEKVENFMEIGILNGATFYLWSSIAKESGTRIGVDYPNAGAFGANEPKTYLQMAAIKQTLESYAPNTHIFFGNSHLDYVLDWTKKVLEEKKLDFLFIDGDHTYEGVKADYEMYSPLVKEDGIIALHDIVESDWHNECNCRVYKLWQELKGEKTEFVSGDRWGGIGCIRKA